MILRHKFARPVQVVAAAIFVGAVAMIQGSTPASRLVPRRPARVAVQSALAKPSYETELIESTPERIRFRIRFDPPTWHVEDTAGTSLRYPVWTGLSPVGRPGEPAIDAAVVRIALPARGRVSVEEAPGNGGRAAGVTFPLVSRPPKEENPFGGQVIRPPRARPGEVPPRHTEILKLGVERGLRTALVAVRPVRRAEGGAGDVYWVESLDVTLDIAGGTAAPKSTSNRPDPVATQLWNASLLNPESVPGFLRSSPQSASIPSVWFDDGAGWLKIHVAQNGIYTLTRDALAQAGVPVSTIDPRTFRIFSGPLVPELAWTNLGWRDTVTAGGDSTQASRWYHVDQRPGFANGFGEPGGMEETDIWVDGESDGKMDAADRVVFYGLGPDNYRDRFGLSPGGEDYFQNPYSDYTVYWLTWEGTFPGSAHRMPTLDVTPGSSTPITDSAARVHAEQNTIYAPSLFEGGLRWESWFWDILSSQTTLSRALVTLPGAVPASTISGRVRLWGANAPEGTGDDALHHVQLDVNSTSQGTTQWGGTTPFQTLSPQDVAVITAPVANPSRFEFRVPSLAPGRLDVQYLAWIDVTYRRTLALGSQPGELELEPGASGRVVGIAQVPPGILDVFDVTNFRHPRRLVGTAAAVSVSGPAILLLALNDPAKSVLAVASRSIPQTPLSVEMDDVAGAWLRDTTEGLDEVIIANDAFVSEGERLAERRRASLPFISSPRVRVVRVSDVMDEFAWGMWDPIALRYFLEYVYRYYGGAGATPLSYAVFLGDHTYDFRNYLGTGIPDFVPSWEDNREDLNFIDTGSVQYVSDDPLVQFDGPDDPFLDVAIGRIPAGSAAAAQAIIEDKILRSEESPVFGSWRARIILATDDICQAGNPDPIFPIFPSVAEQVDQRLPAAFDRAKVYLTEYGTSCTITSKPQASDDFIALWNSGAWLVDYIGHGTETFYADERLLSATDIPSLTNADRLPLLIATASKSAKFNLPGQSSITEAIAMSPQGGALAATGSVSNQTFADVAFLLNQNFVSRLFLSLGCPACPPAPVPAGLAFLEAKNATAGDTKKYVFFGDPAGLPPAAHLGGLSLAGPDSLARGGLAPVTARLQSALPRTPTDDWLLEIRAEDATRLQPLGYRLPGDLMFRGDARFAGDSVAAAFTVPLAAREGPYARIRGYAWNGTTDALTTLTPVEIAGAVDPSLDTQGPIITFNSHPSEMVIGQTVAAVIEDPSGVLLVTSGQPALMLIVLDDQQSEVTRVPLTDYFQYDLGSHVRGTARFPIPQVPANGAYTLRVTAADNFGNSAAATTPVHVSSGATGVSISEVYAYPNPLATDTDVVFTLDRDVEVTLRIFSVAGRLVQKATLPGAPGRNGYHWDGRDQAGDPVANGVYLLQLSAQGNSSDPVKHLERLVVLR